MKRIIAIFSLMVLLLSNVVYAKDIEPKDYFDEADTVVIFNTATKEIVDTFKGEYDEEFLLSDPYLPLNDLALLFIKDNKLLSKDSVVLADYDKDKISLNLYGENYSDEELEEILDSMTSALEEKTPDKKAKITEMMIRVFIFLVLVGVILYVMDYLAKKREVKEKSES